MEKKYGKWFPRKIDADDLESFADWLNSWGDYDKHDECSNGNKITDFGRGYQKAIGDIFDKLNLEWKQFDKRTKIGFKKESS